MDSGSKIKKSLNVVHSDEIWKDHINRELLSQKHWPQKWGFLSEIYDELKPEPRKTEDCCPQSKNQHNKSNFPKTNAQTIGWKSAKLAQQNSYGVSESQARGKCDILKTFNWPHESQ